MRNRIAIFLVSTSLLACESPPDVGESEHALADYTFYIRALGNRCLDLGAPIKNGLGAPVIIKECSKGSPSQQFRVQEIDESSHDFVLRVPSVSSGACVGIPGPGPTAVGKGLETQTCNGSAAQRFAFDGDALLVGTQVIGERVSRDFVIEPLGANTNEGTRVVVGSRELSDAEYWHMYAIDGSETRPTSGFVTVRTEADLDAKLAFGWGTVIELDPPNDSIDITQHLWESPVNGDWHVVRAGVTLRGNRKFLFNGAELQLTKEALQQLAGNLNDNWTLGMEDQARITGIRLRGPSRDGRAEGEPGAGGIVIQQQIAPIKKAIVDHIDASDWIGPAIAMLGARPAHAFDPTHCLSGDENLAYHKGPIAHVVGNFIHHNGREYGVLTSSGANVFVARNLFFQSGHEVVADYIASNRYTLHDSLFTTEGDDNDQEVDVHGKCGSWDDFHSHGTGGVAGDLFDVGWNTFLADRTIMKVRGTPCHYASFHDNVAVGDAGDLKVDTALLAGEQNAYCLAFQPGVPSQILIVAGSNAFGISDPTRVHGAGDFGKGDFDGDGVDDLFLGTGATWWFSAGGKAEWRFLNRMPERASALRFGDFDADGRTDVIALRDNQLLVSWAAGSPWYPLSRTTLTLADFAVGQFDSDKRDDLFAADGTTWRYASGAVGTWNFFATSTYRTKDLRFGDFTGGLRTNVFGIVNGQWQIVRGPNQLWEVLGPARWTNIKDLVIADFDGLGRADVARNEYQSDGSWLWHVSKDGINIFKPLLSSTQALGALPVGKYDSVDGADVLVWNDLNLLLASGGRTLTSWSRQTMR